MTCSALPSPTVTMVVGFVMSLSVCNRSSFATHTCRSNTHHVAGVLHFAWGTVRTAQQAVSQNKGQRQSHLHPSLTFQSSSGDKSSQMFSIAKAPPYCTGSKSCPRVNVAVKLTVTPSSYLRMSGGAEAKAAGIRTAKRGRTSIGAGKQNSKHGTVWTRA